jgi:hypothetical protein
MSTAWLVSYLLLWVIVLLQLLALLALGRVIGRIMRVAIAKPQSPHPLLGQKAPDLSVGDIKEKCPSAPEGEAQSTVLLFLSTTCAACVQLLPTKP